MKKSGFTLIEMITAMALAVGVLAILYSIFNTGNKVFSDADVKSTLQMEAEDIEEELTSIGMQGIGVTDIKIGEVNYEHDKSLYVDKNYFELQNIINEIKSKENGKEPSVRYQIKGYDKDSEYPDDPKPYNISFKDKSLSVNSKILSDHVQSFSVIPQDTNDIFTNTPSIEFNIILHQDKGFSKVDYPINVKVTFRNKV
ncbi:MAG: prepilin-type N-terminal cleavage/methylation domain-containing protein [Bacilli bacterium]|nr:prepilin-type N-terminal cleavage/methylation domain-containing protein [Bacilli bacterium]